MIGKKRLAGLLVVVVLAAACGNAGYEKTKEGMLYNIISKGKGDSIQSGNFLKVHFSSQVGDSVLYSTFGKIPAYGRYDTSIKGAYDFIDFLGEMKVGDSANFSRSVDTLVKRSMAQYGGAFKKGAQIIGQLKILGVFKDEASMTADYEKELAAEKSREIANLEKYLQEEKIPVKKVGSGVFVQMEKEGTGAAIDSGIRVKVNYTGYLKNGNKFDSNTDSAFNHVSPFEFTVGSREVIPGWDEGIRHFKVGGKGKLYIPAMLAYGQQSQGDKMPPFSDLIFDIELLDTVAVPIKGPLDQPHELN